MVIIAGTVAFPKSVCDDWEAITVKTSAPMRNSAMTNNAIGKDFFDGEELCFMCLIVFLSFFLLID